MLVTNNMQWRDNGWVRRGACWVIFALVLGWSPAYGDEPAHADPGRISAYDAAGPSGDAALLEKLHQKGILTDEEYEELKQREERRVPVSTVSTEEYQEQKERDSKIDKMLKHLGGLQIGTLSYFDYSVGKEKDGESFNRFAITRGYINVKKQLTPWLGFRVTPDVHQDDAGDFKLRLKYLYGELRPPDLGFLTDMKSEIGLGHMPWLDFEEHINPYRAQGTMFIERAKTFNSADLGVSLRGHFGGNLGKEYQEKVSHYYPGRWGSWHVGVYNGGGYHASEGNENKVPEWRVSVRPAPDSLPGLQLHYFGLYGDGNKRSVPGAKFPEYQVNLGMLSYQNEWIILTGQYASTLGNNSGSLVVPGTNDALAAEGFSIFFNTKLPVLDRKLNAFARYDNFDPDKDNVVTPGKDNYDLFNVGLAWEFYKHWMLLAVYEQIQYEQNNGGVGKAPVLNSNLEDDRRFQTVLQMKF